MSATNRPWTPGNYLSVPNRKIIFDLREGELKVYLALCDYADSSGQCYPSFEKLAARAGYSRRQTIRIIGQLVQRGLLRVVKQRGTLKPNKPNIYQIMEVGSNPRRGSDKLMSLGGDKPVSPQGSDKLMSPVSKPTSLSKPIYLKEEGEAITDEEQLRRQHNRERLAAMGREFKRTHSL